MDRRSFLQDAGILGVAGSFGFLGTPTRLLAAQDEPKKENPNWVDPRFKATVKASSYAGDPPWGYRPSNIFGDNLFVGWEAYQQAAGAWLEVDFPESRAVSELWILAHPLPRDILGQAPYLLTYSRAKLYAPAHTIRCSVSDGSTISASLRQADFFQILTFPEIQKTASIRIEVEDVWTRPGTSETGLGKVRAFPHRHELRFEIDAWSMYDVHNGKPVQTATLHLVNPGDAVQGARLLVSQNGRSLMEVPLAAIPAHAAIRQNIWIPAPFEDTLQDFSVQTARDNFGPARSLHVPAYRSYFEGGTFSLNCTCHNDLGWLNTQKKTADYRSAEIIPNS